MSSYLTKLISYMVLGIQPLNIRMVMMVARTIHSTISTDSLLTRNYCWRCDHLFSSTSIFLHRWVVLQPSAYMTVRCSKTTAGIDLYLVQLLIVFIVRAHYQHL